MRTNEEIENYFYELEYQFESLDDGMWRVQDEHDDIENLVIYRTGSVLSFRIKLFNIPEEGAHALYRKLLELNASEMVHGAYGIEKDAVIVTAALEVENLDRNELQATIEAIGLALRGHYPTLSKLLNDKR